MELKKYKLGEIATVEISGVDKKSKENEIPVKLCNFTDVYHNWAITKEMEESFMNATANQKEIECFSIKKGQVAFTKDSETRDDIGIPTYIADDFENLLLGYHTALITPDNTKLSGKYLNAFMNTAYIKKYFENNASGSGQRYTLSTNTLNDIPIIAPDLQTQIKIGDLFSKIDSKIALNRRINTKLETIAKRLYDYWFVQFDFPDANGNPYKSSGGKMVWNDALKREIPEGWEVKSIKEIADTYSGGTPLSTNSSYYENGTIPWINSGEVNEPIIVNTNNFITELGLQNSSAKFYPKNTILVAMYGATAGKVSLLTFEATSNQAICGVISKQNEITYYLFLLLSSLCNHYIKISTGSARNNISQEIVKQTMFCVPNEKTLLKFNNVVTPTFNHIVNLSKETSRLTALRDKLLPLLMNGQVEVA